MAKKDTSGTDDNRARALSAALAQIEKQFGKGSIMRLGEGSVTETRIIRGHQMELICKHRYQITKHVRRCGETVEQEDGRSLFIAGFSIE